MAYDDRYPLSAYLNSINLDKKSVFKTEDTLNKDKGLSEESNESNDSSSSDEVTSVILSESESDTK